MLRAEYDLNDNWTAYAAGGAKHTREVGRYNSTTLVGNSGASFTTGSFVPHDEDNTSVMAGLNGKFNTGPVSHKLNFGLTGIWAEQRSAYDFDLTRYSNNIYHPITTPAPVGNFAGGDLNDPGIVGKTFNRSVAISDTLGFFDDRLLVTAGLASSATGGAGLQLRQLRQRPAFVELRRIDHHAGVRHRVQAVGACVVLRQPSSKAWPKGRLRRPALAVSA